MHFSIDANEDDGSLGRLINDAWGGEENSKVRKLEVDGEIHLCVFAIKEIEKGQEITYNYDYSETSFLPWRNSVSSFNTSIFLLLSLRKPLNTP